MTTAVNFEKKNFPGKKSIEKISFRIEIYRIKKVRELIFLKFTFDFEKLTSREKYFEN